MDIPVNVDLSSLNETLARGLDSAAYYLISLLVASVLQCLLQIFRIFQHSKCSGPCGSCYSDVRDRPADAPKSAFSRKFDDGEV